jgi:serine/threonine protein kinase
MKSKSVQPKASDFYFGGTLGVGAYARVVHARLKKNSLEFAIKVILKAHIEKEGKIKQVLMERNILTKLNHPFIVHLFYSFQDKDNLYLCMDLAHFGELAKYIRHKRKVWVDKAGPHADESEAQAFDSDLTRFYGAEILEALSYLHGNGIIHRDLKPENVLITSSGHIKVTDFGSSIKGDEQDASRRSFVGTAEYISPELLNDQAVTGACDFWALGCIIYQMFVGETPFKKPTEYLTFQAIMAHCEAKEEVQKPKHVSEDAFDLIWCLLRPNVSQRLGGGGKAGQWLTTKNSESSSSSSSRGKDNSGNESGGWLKKGTIFGKATAASEGNTESRDGHDNSGRDAPAEEVFSVPTSYDEVKGHSFFAGVAWEGIANPKTRPPASFDLGPEDSFSANNNASGSAKAGKSKSAADSYWRDGVADDSDWFGSNGDEAAALDLASVMSSSK